MAVSVLDPEPEGDAVAAGVREAGAGAVGRAEGEAEGEALPGAADGVKA